MGFNSSLIQFIEEMTLMMARYDAVKRKKSALSVKNWDLKVHLFVKYIKPQKKSVVEQWV